MRVPRSSVKGRTRTDTLTCTIDGRGDAVLGVGTSIGIRGGGKLTDGRWRRLHRVESVQFFPALRGADGTLRGTTAPHHFGQRVPEPVPFPRFQRVRPVPLLERIGLHVVVRHQAGNEFTIQEIVRGVDGAQTRVRVVVGVHAETKRSFCKDGNKTPDG